MSNFETQATVSTVPGQVLTLRHESSGSVGTSVAMVSGVAGAPVRPFQADRHLNPWFSFLSLSAQHCQLSLVRR